MQYMFEDSGLSKVNYDALLIGWNSLPFLQSGVTIGVNGLEYCSGETARQNIINNYSWTFVDDSKNC